MPLAGPQSQAYYSEADIIGYGGAAGGGKLLKLTELLPTPDGFTTIGKVQVGDTLFDKDGAECKVTALSEIEQTPELYEFEFDDGVKITSCVNHRWLTTTPHERKHGREGNVRTTKTIIETLSGSKGRKNHAIALTKPIRTKTQVLNIHPYVLGVWLGDGSKANGNITNIDNQITDRIKQLGYEVSHSTKDLKHHCILGLKVQLREMGLLMNKHIPQHYMRSSYKDRLDLLKGLMDTDGTVAKNSGSAEFCNTNEKIVDGVVELIMSLGWKVRKREGRAMLYGKDCGAKWTLKWVASELVFDLDRKAALQNIAIRSTTTMRYIVSATKVLTEPGRCITVDSPSSTYLASKHMIVTHNTDLAVGKALNQHQRIAIFRREGTELIAIVDRLEELLGTRDGYNGKDRIWRRIKWQLEFGSAPYLGDEKKYQGRPHDLIVFDEAANFLEAQVRFLLGWLRTTDPDQKCQALLCFNPPTTAEGRWIIDFFAPWLDDMHPNPAKPGELRWYAMVNGKEVERENSDSFMSDGDLIKPQSRTFVPSKIKDNPYLMNTGYMGQLQALPEPLRSQMLKGDFNAGMSDNPWQVIPTSWVDAAMARWKPLQNKGIMSSIGVDVARGGADNTVISRRHGTWFDEIIEYPGSETPKGYITAGLVMGVRRDRSPIHIDVVGWGAAAYEALELNNVQVLGLNGAAKSFGCTSQGKLGFANLRAELYWLMRESLDPDNNNAVSLPPDKGLRADLCAPIWSPKSRVVKLEAKEELVKRIGRSPDKGDACVLANVSTMRNEDFPGIKDVPQYDPLKYDPFQ